MPRRIVADDTHRVPWDVEAYRLWFEFLKLVHRDPNLTVSEKLYVGWDSVADSKFDEWWTTHWRKLFAVDRGAREITGSRDWASVSSSKHHIAISVPLDCDVNATLEDIRKLLQVRGAGGLARIRKGESAAAFPIAAKNLKYPALRQLLRIYGYWLDSKGDMDVTATRYYAWAKALNAKRDEWVKKRVKAGKKPYWIKVPEAGWKTYAKGDPDDRRRAMRRYIKKARKIAENVANGQFPGTY